jgi:hypothetical protein
VAVDTDNSFDFLNGYTDKDGNFHDTFAVRKMIGDDEEAIGRNEVKSNGGKVVRTLVERCCIRIGSLMQEDYKPLKWREIVQELDVSELDRVVMVIREQSLGGELKLHNKCPNTECNQELDTYMDIDELEIIPFNGTNVIDFELIDGYTNQQGDLCKIGHMRRPIGSDREVLDPIVRKNIGTANTLLITRCIVDLEGVLIVNNEVVKKMTIRDREYLLKLLQENNYGYKLETDLTCSHCGEEFHATLNVANFI